MDWMTIVQFVLHPDQQLARMLQEYGTLIYAILFGILFCETGLVVTPFLPGDSLLFIAGALWATTARDIVALFAVLIAGSLSGDNCNYWIGRLIGFALTRHCTVSATRISSAWGRTGTVICGSAATVEEPSNWREMDSAATAPRTASRHPMWLAC